MIRWAQDEPLMVWSEDTLFPGSLHPDIPRNTATSKKTVKFLLKNAIWKFLADQLVNPDHPFHAFGSELASRISNIYVHCFPNHSFSRILELPRARVEACANRHLEPKGLTAHSLLGTSEPAARWRVLTVAQLRAAETEQYRKSKVGELVSAFAELVSDKIQLGVLSQDDLRKGMRSGELGKRLEDMLSTGLDFAQLLIGERCGFILKMPDIA